MKHKLHPKNWFTERHAAAMAIAVMAIGLAAGSVNAAFSPKKVTLSNQNRSNASNNPGTAVQYTFALTGQNSGTIKRFEFQWEDTQGTAGCPTGQVTSSAAFGTTTNLGGLTWTVDNAGSGSCLVKFTNATGAAGNVAFTFRVDGITNATALGTDFVRVKTYDATSGGTLLDEDVVAYVIANSTVQVTADVGETLSFSLSSTAIALSPLLNSGNTANGTHTMDVATNAASGYEINASGSTLTKGSDTIPFVTDGDTTITAGTSEYGVKVTTCGGSATCAADYRGMPELGIIANAGPTNTQTHTIEYKAAASAAQAAGSYTSNISYVAVGRF